MMLAMIAGAIAGAAFGQQKAEPAGPKPIARAQFLASMDSEFRKMDSDKNGQVTKAEVEQFQQQQAVAAAEARNRAQFVKLDTNKNGQLSPAEFAKLAPPPATTNGQPMLARMDGNRDSQISLGEYRAATLANFDRLDTDKDGTVTPTEMKAGGVAPR
jgi:Ca2+-binding EF-hand superfamily protein